MIITLQFSTGTSYETEKFESSASAKEYMDNVIPGGTLIKISIEFPDSPEPYKTQWSNKGHLKSWIDSIISGVEQ